MSESGNGFFTNQLKTIDRIVSRGPDRNGTLAILGIIGIPGINRRVISRIKLYNEFLPKLVEVPFSEEQRNLQFLWDVFERSPLSVPINFAIPFRRILAKKIFCHCGKNFCAGAIRFNFGKNLSVGDDVFFDPGTFIDSKGGVTIGDAVGIGYSVCIFTHTHSESDHAQRTYAPVKIGNYVKIYSGAMILPGVSIGDQAIVAGGSVVSRDVPENTVVAGTPAKAIRARRNEGRFKKDLNHFWLHKAAFQDE